MQSKKLLSLALALLLVLPGYARAGSWVRIGETADGEYSVDRETIALRDGIVRYSEEWKFRTPRTTSDGKEFAISVLALEVNCERREFVIGNFALYTADRVFVKNLWIPPAKRQFKEIVPDTARDRTRKYACTYVQASTRNAPTSSPAPSPAEPQEQFTSSGSGFAIDRRGTVVTNDHVITGCNTFEVRQSGRSYPAQLVAKDSTFDLAILRTNVAFPEASLRNTPSAVGETVYVAGFPLTGVLSGDMNFTDGVVASGTGIRGNLAQLQITAPVQQGNSGGPLLDQSGNVVGVVVSKLNVLRVAGATGDIPQNVNFAIKVDVLRMFMDANRISYTSRPSGTRLDAVEVANRARLSTVQVVCR